jgi:catechol 2,3-dioxygenase-like lactoylglutathione lyase family enzyme
MITGAHVVIYSTDAEKDRAFFRDVLKFPSVDVGRGWLIFGLPPAEVAVHPAASGDRHQLYLMTGDVRQFVASMRGRGVPCDEVQMLPWGIVTSVTLPGGGKVGVYEPRHARPSADQERLTV